MRVSSLKVLEHLRHAMCILRRLSSTEYSSADPAGTRSLRPEAGPLWFLHLENRELCWKRELESMCDLSVAELSLQHGQRLANRRSES
jgi:hypothetical protein